MQPDTQVQLGALVLQDFEIPERINFGGAQRLGVHQLPGGVRIIDAMGADDADLSWSGMFLGPDADERARYVDYLRRHGSPVTLSWGVHIYDVLIAAFEPNYERFYQIPYRIACKVVQDLTNPITAPPPSVDDLAQADLANVLTSAQALGMTVPNTLPGAYSTTVGAPAPLSIAVTAAAQGVGLDLPDVASSLTTLRAAMSQVTSFVGAAAPEILPVLAGIAGTNSAVTKALALSESALTGNAGGVGGVIGGVLGGPALAARFAGYSAIAQQAALMRPMQGFLQRMNTNITQGAV